MSHAVNKTLYYYYILLLPLPPQLPRLPLLAFYGHYLGGPVLAGNHN